RESDRVLALLRAGDLRRGRVVPLRSIEPDPQLVEAAVLSRPPGHVEEMMDLRAERVEAPQRLHQAVHGLLALFHEGAEEAVPAAEGGAGVRVRGAGFHRV